LRKHALRHYNAVNLAIEHRTFFRWLTALNAMPSPGRDKSSSAALPITARAVGMFFKMSTTRSRGNWN
jgi:hypothetical protein